MSKRLTNKKRIELNKNVKMKRKYKKGVKKIRKGFKRNINMENYA